MNASFGVIDRRFESVDVRETFTDSLERLMDSRERDVDVLVADGDVVDRSAAAPIDLVDAHDVFVDSRVAESDLRSAGTDVVIVAAPIQLNVCVGRVKFSDALLRARVVASLSWIAPSWRGSIGTP